MNPETLRLSGVYGEGIFPSNPIHPSCRHCGGETHKPSLLTGYWAGLKYAVHERCLKDGQESEAFFCQTIDADCNDCKHFERGRRWENSKRDFDGHCRKFNKPTTAHVKFASCRECFEHRKGA